MAYSITKAEIIDYPAKALYDFQVLMFEWIDNLQFTLLPSECLEDPSEYIEIAKKRFLEAGWEGDGEITLMWVPPFMLQADLQWGLTKGVVVWHVKQLEDGTSWLLFPSVLSVDGYLSS